MRRICRTGMPHAWAWGMKPQIIVVGVDFSEASELAVQQAFLLATAPPGAEVHLVNVVQTYGTQVTYEMPVDASALSVLSMAEARERFGRYADRALTSFQALHPGRAVPRVVAHVRCDAIADEIAQLAADLEAARAARAIATAARVERRGHRAPGAVPGAGGQAQGCARGPTAH